MRILRCHIKNFGCYSNKIFDFSNNLNSFCLKNGEGKTTLATFIKSMFYSLEKNMKDSYERKRYNPYTGGVYGGSLEFELNNEIYKIERTFDKKIQNDTLKIFNSKGEQLDTFLNKPLELLQGKNSYELGELIFGIDSAAFSRCNYISAKDLDFANNESIKMKIGNIVIDREKENSYEETYEFIEKDLRSKKPTKLNEAAYPFKVKELNNIIKDKKKEIVEISKKENELQELYEERNAVEEEIDAIEIKQKEFSHIHVLKGKMTTVENYNKEIEEYKKIIDQINEKFENNIPTSEEIDSLKEYIKEYKKYKSFDEKYEITQSQIEKLISLEGSVLIDEEYEKIVSANGIISNCQKGLSLEKVDIERLDELKLKFERKEIKEESIIENEYIEYKTEKKQIDNIDNNFKTNTKEYPSSNVLDQIEKEISEYNNFAKEIEEIKSSKKELPLIVKIILCIITFGIYFFVLNNKKKEHLALVNKKEEELNKFKNELNAFFEKYNKTTGSYELRLVELKDEITDYQKHLNENIEKNEEYQKRLKAFEEKERKFLNYFIMFGYINLDAEEVYKSYKNDFKEYKSLLEKYQNYIKVKEENENIINEQNKIINEILSKYSISRKENLSDQISELKDNIDFFKKFKSIYIDKNKNNDEILKYENKISNILKLYNIDYGDDIILSSSGVIKDISDYNDVKEKRITLLGKKEDFIKENNLEGFVVENVEAEEECLRKKHEELTAKLKTKDNYIEIIEEDIEKKEILQNEIKRSEELIEEYKHKIEIAEYARDILSAAKREMEEKFIDPIKNSFIDYAKKIYEKMGSNVSMDYDYNVTYDVKGYEINSEDLSDGERTIMMLALRFAILDTMYKEHNSLIILDDPFDSLDNEKLIKAKELIKLLSNEWQIIYFTCHDSREIILNK